MSCPPSSRRQWKRSLFAGFPGLALVRPQAFSASRRFSPLPPSQACFILQPRPGFPLPNRKPKAVWNLGRTLTLPYPCGLSVASALPARASGFPATVATGPVKLQLLWLAYSDQVSPLLSSRFLSGSTLAGYSFREPRPEDHLPAANSCGIDFRQAWGREHSPFRVPAFTFQPPRDSVRDIPVRY
jgi:hypothetical protein